MVVPPPMPGVSRTEERILVDLFEYQSIPQGSWMVPDVAGCVI
jgi:hypothetical protein